jgi:hypothetical protein
MALLPLWHQSPSVSSWRSSSASDSPFFQYLIANIQLISLRTKHQEIADFILNTNEFLHIFH